MDHETGSHFIKAEKYGIQKPYQDQLVAQQKHLLRVEEMQHADWLICLVGIQDGSITTNLLRDKLRV